MMRVLRWSLYIMVLVLFGTANVKLITSLISADKKNSELKSKISDLKKQNDMMQDRFLLKKCHLDTMLNGDAFIQDVIRQREGYIKPNETVFRFEN